MAVPIGVLISRPNPPTLLNQRGIVLRENGCRLQVQVVQPMIKISWQLEIEDAEKTPACMWAHQKEGRGQERHQRLCSPACGWWCDGIVP